MKKSSVLRLTLFFLLAFLFQLFSNTPQARAAGKNLITGWVLLMPIAPPPAQMCVKDSVPINFMIKSDYPIPYTISKASNGSLSLPVSTIMGGRQFVTVNGSFEATRVGGGFITIGTSVSSEGINWEFEVVECQYYVSISAAYTQESDWVSFRVYAVGAGDISTSNGVSGTGIYHVYIRPSFDETNPEVACQVKGELSGSSTFTVKGNRNGENLTLSFDFDLLQLGESPKFECKDANDRQAALSIFENATINPNQDLWLTAVQFPISGGTYPFPFGRSGSGTVQVVSKEAQ